MRISELKPGDQVRLRDFGETNSFYRRKLLSLGLTRGVGLSVIRVAPLGCPMQIEVKGTSLTLRQEEACHIIWEKV